MKTLLTSILLLVALFVNSAQAETIAATTGSATPTYKYRVDSLPSQTLDTSASGSAAKFCTMNALYSNCSASAVNTSTLSWLVNFSYNGTAGNQSPGTIVETCAVGTLNTHMCVGIKSCPTGQNWTLSGSTCTRPDCVSPQVRNSSTGVCESPCQSGYDRNTAGVCVKNCTGKQGMATANGNYSFDGPVSEWSVGECKVYCPKRVLAAGGGNGYDCTFTGASASPNNPEAGALKPETQLPPDSPLNCAAKGQGYIQSSTGTTTCVPAVDAPPDKKPTIQEDKKSEGGKPGSDGKPDKTSPDYEGKSSSTESSGGKSTTTETTTRNPTTDSNGAKICPAGFVLSSDGNTCTKTTVTTQDTSDFCTQNPNAAACKGTSDECIDHPERVSCKTLGSYDDSGEVLQTKSLLSSSLSPVGVAGGSGSCPSDVSLPKGMKFSWHAVCDGATAVKPFFLVCAWLAASLIVMGLGSRGSA